MLTSIGFDQAKRAPDNPNEIQSTVVPETKTIILKPMKTLN